MRSEKSVSCCPWSVVSAGHSSDRPFFCAKRHKSCSRDASDFAFFPGYGATADRALLTNMKSFLVFVSGLLLCSCADVVVTKTDVSTPGGAYVAPMDTKDFGSTAVHMTTNCGVGAYDPKAIYIRPFCIDNAIVEGDISHSDGDAPIAKALIPVEFAQDLKETLETMAPARILKDHESPRTGWLVEGTINHVDGGSPLARWFVGIFGAGRSFVAMHVRVTDIDRGVVIYEFDMAGGSGNQGKYGTLRASGVGRATNFDLRNAAERVYLTLSVNPNHYGAHSGIVMRQ